MQLTESKLQYLLNEVAKRVLMEKYQGEVIIDDKSQIENELRQFFLPNGKNMPNNPSMKAMQQFMRFTDATIAGKNVAGGAMFTSNNREKDEFKQMYGNVYYNVIEIRKIVYKIKTMLEDNKRLDFQQLERISYWLDDLNTELPVAVYNLLDDPAIKDNNSKFMQTVGHNVGFRDFILKQFLKDIKNGVYSNLINRINSVIKAGHNPLSYRERY